MPLVHPSKPQFRKYLTEKISGTYNLAFAYKKPMLCPEDMAVYEDFKDTSVFYNLNKPTLQTIFPLPTPPIYTNW